MLGGCTPQPFPSAPVTVGATATAVPSSPTPSPSGSTATATPTAAPLELSSVVNFRDVAGEGVSLAGGGRAATGVVYRSAKLSTASAADVARLRRAGVSLVIDLRTAKVVRSQPDPTIKGAHQVHVDLFGPDGGRSGDNATVARARAAMRQMNVEFVSSAYERARTADVLDLVAAAEGPVVVHCQAGKDRTGWISAVLLLVAGADRDIVITEYLKSNTYRAAAIVASYRRTLKAEGLTAARIDRAYERVEASYLTAGLDELDQRYGSVEGYLRDGLGLSDATVAALRDRLTA